MQRIGQHMLVLCGLPGSGKTTLSQQLASLGYVWVNQDTLGNRKKCEAAVRAALLSGQSVIVDRCNFNASQRSTWVQLAYEMCGNRIQIICIALIVAPHECVQRGLQRVNHPTLGGAQMAPVVNRMLSQWEDPTPEESFHRIIFARTPACINNVIQMAAEMHEGVPPPPMSFAPPPQPMFAAPQNRQATLHEMWRAPQPPPPPQPPVDPWHTNSHHAFNPHPQSHLPPGFGDFEQIHHMPSNSAQDFAPPEHYPTDPPHSIHTPPRQKHTYQQHEQEETQYQHNTPTTPSISSPHPARARPHPTIPSTPTTHGTKLDADSADPRPILLFDLNGTLTSHTSKRKSSGRNRLRPGTQELLRLLPHFRVGIFTSSTSRTVATVMKMVEEAVGQPLLDPGLILFRDHTAPCSKEHIAAGGDPWDTMKPLGRWFSRLHRVVLFDDDAYKSVEGEERNMVLVPCWDNEDPECTVVGRLVDVVLEVLGGIGPEGDVRELTERITSGIKAPGVSSDSSGAGEQVLCTQELQVVE